MHRVWSRQACLRAVAADRAREGLGDEAYTKSFDAGRDTSPDDQIALLQGPPDVPPDTRSSTPGG